MEPAEEVEAQPRRTYVDRSFHYYQYRQADAAFKTAFRMSRATFQILMLTVGMYFPDGQSPNRRSLDGAHKLLLFLKFAGHNEYYSCLSVSIFTIFLVCLCTIIHVQFIIVIDQECPRIQDFSAILYRAYLIKLLVHDHLLCCFGVCPCPKS